jgi:hypothetical protein
MPSVQKHPELILISALVNTGATALIAKHGIDSSWFHTYDEEWAFIYRYMRRHNRLPSRQLVKIKTKLNLLQVDDVEYAIETALKAHVEASLVKIIGQATASLGESEPNADAIMGKLRAGITTIQNATSGERREHDIVADWEDAYEYVKGAQARTATSGISGVPFGFKTLDGETGGAQPGEVWVVAARLGQGKSWTLLRMAAAALCAGNRVQFDAMEMNKTQVALRIHALLSGSSGQAVFSASDLRSGSVNLVAYKKFLRDKLPKLIGPGGNLLVNDTSRGRVTPMSVSAQIERNNPTINYLDYITLMSASETPGRMNHREQWQAIAAISSELTGMAMQYEIPIVVAAQINRLGIGKGAPGVEALSGSDAIGHDATGVITMKRLSEHVMLMKLAKYRNGRDGFSWYCEFATNSGRYEEIDKDKAMDLIAQDKSSNDDDD